MAAAASAAGAAAEPASGELLLSEGCWAGALGRVGAPRARPGRAGGEANSVESWATPPGPVRRAGLPRDRPDGPWPATVAARARRGTGSAGVAPPAAAGGRLLRESASRRSVCRSIADDAVSAARQCSPLATAPLPHPSRSSPCPAAVSSSAGTAAKRFEVKKWNAVAFWSWDVEQDRCAICRNSIYEPSIEIQAAGLTVSARALPTGPPHEHGRRKPALQRRARVRLLGEWRGLPPRAPSLLLDVTISWGECNHCFHLECISRWLRSNNTCPLCSAEWVSARVQRHE
ncbi:rbx-1 [Symbiodinium sp. KB8]|nr:rbx-1 [Symbiodinium sp. KB8]